MCLKFRYFDRIPPKEVPPFANSEQEILVDWAVTDSNVCFGFQINASQLCPPYSLGDHTSHAVKSRLGHRETKDAVSRARAGALWGQKLCSGWYAH